MTIAKDNVIVGWLEEHLKNLIYTGIAVVATIVLLIILRMIVSGIRKKSKNKRSFTVTKLLENIFKYAVVIIMLFVILKIWGIDVTAALAGVGIVGLVIGLGAQDLIKDFLAGMGIVFDNQYEIDDVVEINGFKGKVMEIGLRSTKLINFYGEIKIIRNGSIHEISNFSRSFSVSVINVNIAYNENIDRVFDILKDKLPQIKNRFPQIIEGPSIDGIDELGESGIAVRIAVKTNPEEHYEVRRGILKYIKEVFDENGVEIPFNQIVIHEAGKEKER